MARSKKNQSAHDRLVEKNARKYLDQGYKVQADISGFAKPRTFYGNRPDIIAIKGKKRIIEEIETPKSANTSRDLKQQAAFKRVAGLSSNTTFKRRIT